MSFVLTIDDVLSIYRDALGSQALLVNGFIFRTKPTQDGTAAISKDGTLYYCPKFFEEECNTPEKVRDVIMHELMHPVLGDMNRDHGWLPNIAGDIVINAMLYNLKLATCEFQRTYYPADEAPYCLMRPGAKPPKEVLGIYASVYPNEFKNTYQLDELGMRCENPLEIMRALQTVYPDGLPSDSLGYILLGAHDGNLPTMTEDDEYLPPEIWGVPSEVTGDIAEICEEKAEMSGGGYGSHAEDMVVRILRSRKRIKTQLLRGFDTNNVANKLKQYYKGIVHSRSMVPTTVSRNEAAKIVMGMPPLFYRKKVPTENALQKRGVAFYLDVSGSVYPYLPAILGIFKNLQDEVSAVYCFSNQVVEIPKDRFMQGLIQTTGGTDFNCIIDHAIEKEHEKILVFSDGDAHADEKHRAMARRSIKKMGIVYFGDYVRANWIDQQYHCSYVLEDLLGD